MQIAKKIRGLVTGPRRHFNKMRVQAFVVGYNNVVSQYNKMGEKTVRAVKELKLGVISGDNRRYFGGKVLDNEKKGGQFAEEIKALLERWSQDECINADAVWLQDVFLPYLEERRAKDLTRLQKMFGFGKGVPLVEED